MKISKFLSLSLVFSISILYAEEEPNTTVKNEEVNEQEKIQSCKKLLEQFVKDFEEECLIKATLIHSFGEYKINRLKKNGEIDSIVLFNRFGKKSLLTLIKSSKGIVIEHDAESLIKNIEIMFQLRRLPPCLARSLLAQRAIWTKGQIGQEFGEVHISRTTIKVEKTTGESSSSMTYKGAQTIIPEEEFNEKQDRIVNYVSKDCLGCCKKVGFNQD